MDCHVIQQSEFAQQLGDLQLTDLQLRHLVLEYCKQYQEVYGFEQLDNAFAFLEIRYGSNDYDPKDWAKELAAVIEEVEYAMGEYFISLNEVATVIYRLLDQRKMNTHEALDTINQVWLAHLCNEAPEVFIPREDRVLCELLKRIE